MKSPQPHDVHSLSSRLAHFDGVAVNTNRGTIGSIGASPDRQRRGQESDRGDQQRIRHPQAYPGTQLRPNHALEAKLRIPHDVGDELRQAKEQADDDGKRQHHTD